MKGLLCNTSAKTNEEYKKVIKRRMNIIALLGLSGGITFAVAVLTKFYWKTPIEDYTLGLLFGFGVGLIIVSAGLWIKNLLLLRNEEKLKESRLVSTDERIREISNRAFRSAALILIIVMYLTVLICAFTYPVMVQIMLALISIFLLSYVISYRILYKRM